VSRVAWVLSVPLIAVACFIIVGEATQDTSGFGMIWVLLIAVPALVLASLIVSVSAVRTSRRKVRDAERALR
jgi:hypothetical protein